MTFTDLAPHLEAIPDGSTRGREARREVPRSLHGDWKAAARRPDPVGLLEQQAVIRLPDLVPIRHGRMLASPFAFYRGAAVVMANDLAAVRPSGLEVQLCGDAHASNFGLFATPERELIFDINDFDETARGPFEWDLKRLAASLVIAARQREFSARDRHDIAASCVRSYRAAMHEFARMGNLAVWYARLDLQAIQAWRGELAHRQIAAGRREAAKARTKDSARALAKLTSFEHGRLHFRSDPPLLVPIDEFASGSQRLELSTQLQELLEAYQLSVRPEIRLFLSTYNLVDIAHKVVGVGSVGLRAWVVLLTGRHADPLVLQAKEAQSSVLEPFTGTSPFANHGERVVVGQRSMQATSDMLLGWLSVIGLDGAERDFYIRQLWDWKGGADLEVMVPKGMRVYGEVCAWTLARAHARSGDPLAIAAYVGKGSAFDLAIAAFAESYADQNEKDYAAFRVAQREGRVAAQEGI